MKTGDIEREKSRMKKQLVRKKWDLSCQQFLYGMIASLSLHLHLQLHLHLHLYTDPDLIVYGEYHHRELREERKVIGSKHHLSSKNHLISHHPGIDQTARKANSKQLSLLSLRISLSASASAASSASASIYGS
jgi:hypothetical protein